MDKLEYIYKQLKLSYYDLCLKELTIKSEYNSSIILGEFIELINALNENNITYEVIDENHLKIISY